MSHLSPKDLEDLARRLNQRRQELTAALRHRVRQAGRRFTPHDPEACPAPDAAEPALELSHWDAEDLSQELAELRAIADASERLAAASYGACAACKSLIALERLRAHPAAHLCLNCQKSLELHPGHQS